VSAAAADISAKLIELRAGLARGRSACRQIPIAPEA
jgi:hypothetical protein